MKKFSKHFLRMLVLLAVVTGVGSGVWSFTKSGMGFTTPVIVSADGIEKNDSNQLLQVVSKQQTSDISGLSYFYGLTAYNEAIVATGLPRQQIIAIRNSEKLKKRNKPDEYGNELNENLYRLNLTTLTKKPISINVNLGNGPNMMPYVSPDGKMIFFSRAYDGNYFLYNIKSGKSKKINFKKNSLARWSNDGKCLLGYNSLKGLPFSYFIYDVYTGKLKNIKILKRKNEDIFDIPQSKDGKVLYNESIGGYYIKKGVFFSEDKIYEQNVSRNTIKTLMDFSGIGDYRINNYKVNNNGKTIIFSAVTNNKYGLYVYNVDEKKYYTVIQIANKNTVNLKDSPNQKQIDFKIAPSGDKIAYAIIEYKPGRVIKMTLYTAKLEGKLIKNKISLGTYYNSFPMTASIPIRWNVEGNKLFLLTSKEFRIGKLTYTDNGQLTTFTFNQ